MAEKQINILDIPKLKEGIDVFKIFVNASLKQKDIKYEVMKDNIIAMNSIDIAIEQLDKCQKILIELEKQHKESQQSNNTID